MSGPAVVISALVGLVVGPLLRHAVDQVPLRRPVLRRRSADDGPPLRPADLVAIWSWMQDEPAATIVPVGSPDDHPDGERPVERRRWRAPAIDIGAAVVLGILGGRFGWSVQLPAFLAWGAALVVVTVIDIDHYRIPDRVVFPAFGAAVVLLGAALAIGDPTDVRGMAMAASLGALGYFGFLFVFFLVSPSGMGFGDVKLALLLGLHLGWAGAAVDADGVLGFVGSVHGLRLVLIGGLIGSVLGSVVGLGAMAARGRRAHFPFGPSLCVGALLAVVFSEQILR
ncbi:MAG: prepilin peptidase [Acidimicrobiia bacterium]|nr:prepilin peptidase [Acidimicrobiia bacterium]